MTISDVKHIIWAHHRNYDYRLFNSFIFHWESDFFASAPQSHYCIEIEIKMSRSDFKADFNKTLRISDDKKHSILQDKSKLYKPNKFAFACPEGLIQKYELPDEYGLYYAIDKTHHLEPVKQPKFLHKNNMFKDINFVTQLMNKFYYRNIDLRIALGIREYDAKYGQKNIDYSLY
jgi:hypothetical protein